MWKESIRTLRQIAMTKERMGGGATWALHIGPQMLYIAGSIGMAIAVHTKQLDFVNDWMLLPMPNPDSDRYEEQQWGRIFSVQHLPEGFKVNYEKPFEFLLRISESDYLSGLLPPKERLVECLFLSNLLQSLIELRHCTEDEKIRKVLEDKGRLDLDVLPFWCLMDAKDFQPLTWDLFGSSKGVADFVFPSGFVTIDKFWPWWKNWKAICCEALDLHFRRGFLILGRKVNWLTLPGEPYPEKG